MTKRPNPPSTTMRSEKRTIIPDGTDAASHGDEHDARLEQLLDEIADELGETLGAIPTDVGVGYADAERIMPRHAAQAPTVSGVVQVVSDDESGVVSTDSLDRAHPAHRAAIRDQHSIDDPAFAIHARAPPRASWRAAIEHTSTGEELIRVLDTSGQFDSAYLVASTMVAIGTATEAVMLRYRPLVVPLKRPLGPSQWSLVRHDDDTVELGELFELLAPAVHALTPITLDDCDLHADLRVEDVDHLALGRARARVAKVLGVAEDTPIYERSDLANQIHVAACQPSVLVAGSDALRSSDGPELVFRVARALTFLPPGRAVGGSRLGRVMKAVVLAIIRDAVGTTSGSESSLATAAEYALARLTPAVRAEARAAARRLLSCSNVVNASAWSRSLSRTANRVGLLLCGDPPTALKLAAEIGPPDEDLIEFAYSMQHERLRAWLFSS